MTVSRVLYLTVIYLRAALPRYSSHPGSGRANLYAPIPVLLRIEFTASDTLEPMGELLPRLSTLTSEEAVYLCCTFPEVAFGGRYPLSLPCGARTFLMNSFRLVPATVWPTRRVYCTGWRRKSQPEIGVLRRGAAALADQQGDEGIDILRQQSQYEETNRAELPDKQCSCDPR